MLLLMLLFLTFSVLVAKSKLLYMVVIPVRGLLNIKKRTKRKVWERPSPSYSIGENMPRLDAGFGPSRVHTRIILARRLG